jgi:hypothetical protein
MPYPPKWEEQGEKERGVGIRLSSSEYETETPKHEIMILQTAVKILIRFN